MSDIKQYFFQIDPELLVAVFVLIILIILYLIVPYACATCNTDWITQLITMFAGVIGGALRAGLKNDNGNNKEHNE